MLQTAMPSTRQGAAMAIAATGGMFSQEAAALQPVVRAVVACVLGEDRRHPDVDDCTHETLRRALEGRGRLREGEALRPWLLGIARHVAIDARRRRRRERLVDDPGSADEEPLLDRLPDPGPSPDERASKAEQARRISAAMEGLSKKQREVLVMFHVDGEGYQEIADRLGIPLGTVATWLSRGRRALAEALAGKVEQ